MIFDTVNKRVIGKMKHEFLGKIISEFVGLMSKMYFLVDVNGMKSKKAKGIKNLLMFRLIKKMIRHKMKRIQSKLHKIQT